MLQTLVYVALGGAIGASGRYLVSQMAARLLGASFPWGTITVNVVGSLAMGVLAACLMSTKTTSPAVPFLMTGILGGFTTFSAFSLDALMLVERGQMGSAALYVALSVVLSIGAVALGYGLTRGLFA